MNEIEFSKYLKKSGKKPHVVDQLVQQVKNFEIFLSTDRQKNLELAEEDDLSAFIAKLDASQPGSASKRVRGLALYFRFTGNSQMATLASDFREAEINKGRNAFALKEFRGVDPQAIQKLKAAQIITTEHILAAGKTLHDRQGLADKTGLSYQAILELVKLSDLSRLPGVKGTRARLYVDAGINTLEKLASLEPEELIRITSEFVARTSFDGIPPLPKEAQNTVKTARELPKIVEYE